MLVSIRPKELTIPANKWFQVNLLPFIFLTFIKNSSTIIDIKQFVKQVIHVSVIIKSHFSFFSPNSRLTISSCAIPYNIKNIRNAIQESVGVHRLITSISYLLEIFWTIAPESDKADVYSNMYESTKGSSDVKLEFFVCSLCPSLRLMNNQKWR